MLMYPCSAHIVTLVPHRSPLLLLLCPYIIIVMSALIMLCPLRLLYIERRYFHLYHPRIVHLCNVKEVAPSKRLNSKALIYLFYLFLSWFHNMLHHCILHHAALIMIIIMPPMSMILFINMLPFKSMIIMLPLLICISSLSCWLCIIHYHVSCAPFIIMLSMHHSLTCRLCIIR